MSSYLKFKVDDLKGSKSWEESTCSVKAVLVAYGINILGYLELPQQKTGFKLGATSYG